jgi:hypothetical protein
MFSLKIASSFTSIHSIVAEPLSLALTSIENSVVAPAPVPAVNIMMAKHFTKDQRFKS